MDKKVLSRDIEIVENKIVITESTMSTLNLDQVEMRIRELQSRKLRLREQNEILVQEYSAIANEEQELQTLAQQLRDPVTPPESI